MRAYRGSTLVSEMLLYHFGYGEFGPARPGKRLRPQIVLRTALSEGASVEAALDAAAAVELLHNYSLVHDDIEDRDELRRGRATLWSRYGIAQAINAGDAMCAISFLTLLHADEHLPAERVIAMTRILHDAHRVMCDGQSLDLAFEREAFVDLDRYTQMIAAKTAALFEAACILGAQSAQLDAKTIAAYGAAGRAYGLAFQIRDDVLGIWGATDATGKVEANDLARRKWTFPVAWALAQPPSAARSAIAEAYAEGTELEPERVAQAIEALDALGAREAAMRAAAEPMAVVEQLANPKLRDYLLGTLAQAVG